MRDRKQRQFEPRGNARLVEDVRQVALHGLLAERELLGDIAIAAAFHDATHHVEFARGQAVGLALRRLGLAHQLVQRRDQVHDTLAADPVVTGIHRANGRVQRARQGIFQHNAARADVQRLDNLLSRDGGSEKHDLDGRRAVHDGAHGFEARQARHLNIEKKDVGRQLQGLRDGVVAVVGFAYYLEAVASR